MPAPLLRERAVRRRLPMYGRMTGSGGLDILGASQPLEAIDQLHGLQLGEPAGRAAEVCLAAQAGHIGDAEAGAESVERRCSLLAHLNLVGVEITDQPRDQTKL